jgi:hypothetical protein
MRKTKLWMLALAGVVFMSAGARAQDVKGSTFVNGGVGIGTVDFKGPGGIPFIVSVDHGLTDQISAGVFAGLFNTRVENDFRFRYHLAGARGSYHFNKLLKLNNEHLDIYGGLSMYYVRYKSEYKGTNAIDYQSSGSSLDFGLHAGARYLLNGKVGFFGELGYRITPVQLGVSVKF